MKLHALDAKSWTETIWNALGAHKEDQETYFKENPEELDDINSAMAYIEEALGVQDQPDETGE
jgi:hypothetical protein